MALDPSNGLLFFFTVFMVLPLVAFFFVERFSKNQLLELILRRGVLILFFLTSIITTSVVGIMSRDAGVGLEGIAFTLTYVFNLALVAGMMAVFFITIKDYLWTARKLHSSDPDRRVAEQNEEEDEDD